MSTANVIFQKGFRKTLVKGTMVVSVAISGTSFLNFDITPPVKTKVAVPESKQTVSFIKKTALAYTEPKQSAKLYVISGAYKGANPMRKNASSSYFFEKEKDLHLPKVSSEETYDFDEEFEYVSAAPIKYNYSVNDAIKDFDTSSFNKYSETTFEF